MASSAYGAQSDWVETEGGAMRLVLSSESHQPVRGFLEIKLHSGWKTYWRDPGDGGIPPSLTGKDQTIELLYPAPERISDNGLVFSGYHNGVRLPFMMPEGLTDGEKLSAFIGICSEVCVPFQGEFTVKSNTADAQPVDDAFSQLPKAADEAYLKTSREGMFLVVNSDAIAPEAELFLAPERGVYFGIPEIQSGGFKIEILKEKTPGLEVNYTLKTISGAVTGTFIMPK